MFGLHPRLVGAVLLGIAAVILIIAALIGWGAVQRWRAIAAIEEHHLARLAGRANAAKDAAQLAASLLPDDAMAALPAIDPSADDAGTRLERLVREAEPRDRAVVTATAAFATALRGSRPDGTEGVDGALLAHLVALGKGELPPFPTLPANAAPQAAILAHVAQRHAAAAWKAGNREQLARGLGLVLLARPSHAEVKPAAVLLAALDPTVDRPTLAAAVATVGAQGDAILRRAALLAPERAPVLFSAIAADKRTPEEAQRIVAAGGEPGETLDALVAKGIASPSPALLASLFRRCLDQDKTELAAKLVAAAAEPQKRDLRIALAQHLGDLPTLSSLQPERADLKPTASRPVGGPGIIAFHIGTATGIIPRVGELTARADGKLIPPARIKRWGSLVVLTMPGVSGVVELDVALGGTTIFAGGVRL